MEDDRIKNLFDDFQPELPPSSQFMTRLKRNMEMVEILRKENEALIRRNRLAVAISAMSGFAAGIVMALLFPLIRNWIATFSISLPFLPADNIMITVDYSFAAWIIMAGVSVVTALNTYEMAMAKLTR